MIVMNLGIVTLTALLNESCTRHNRCEFAPGVQSNNPDNQVMQSKRLDWNIRCSVVFSVAAYLALWFEAY